MLKTENTEVVGWEHAIRGMRNPMNNWDKSDSNMTVAAIEEGWSWLGENDLDLMVRLRNAGTDHRKFMRMLTVYVDITAPLYWWKEFDTYKVGTVANSCSTMHKIHAKPIEVSDFSVDHLTPASLAKFEKFVAYIESVRLQYVETKEKAYWYDLIQLLPSSYNQMRTVTLNYEVLASMYYARRTHKLDEWHELCRWMESLPYAKELIVGDSEGKEGL